MNEQKIIYQNYLLSIGKVIIQSDEKSIIRISASYDGEKGIQKDNRLLNQAAEQLKEYLEGKRKEFDLPFQPRGTEFQEKVWKELCKVPYGKTATYQEIAERIGNEKACRAVGMACGKNPIFIVIPCHRIIGKNGNLTGYAEGLEMKQKLLLLERENTFSIDNK